jgi:hypothetical protein
MAALSLLDPTLPIEPRRPLFFSRRTTFLERNQMPTSAFDVRDWVVQAMSQGAVMKPAR